MSRKTRQQKEKARQRMLSQTSLNTPDAELVKREFTFSLKDIKNKKNSFESTKKNEVSAFSDAAYASLPDIARSIFLAAILFSLELVIYFVWFK